MSNTPARVPFARTQANDVPDKETNRALSTIDQNLQRIERQQAGLFQPRVLVFGMPGNPSPYVVRATDWLILCDCTNGAIAVTVPLAARLDGLQVTVVKIDATANAVTLTATISGRVNPTLATQYQSKTIDAGNGVWYFAPNLTAADIGPGKFPAGNYEFPNDVAIDGLLDLSAATAGQIKFPATQNPSSNANTLDDYEEGTWTPTISSGITSPVYATQAGNYTKVGRLVTYDVTLGLSGGTRNGSQLAIAGLPFSVLGLSATAVPGQVSNVVAAGTPIPSGALFLTSIFFYKTDGTSFVGTSLVSAAIEIHLSGLYFQV